MTDAEDDTQQSPKDLPSLHSAGQYKVVHIAAKYSELIHDKKLPPPPQSHLKLKYTLTICALIENGYMPDLR